MDVDLLGTDRKTVADTSHALPQSTSKLKLINPPDAFGDVSWQRGVKLAAFDLIGVILSGAAGLLFSVVLRNILDTPQPLRLVTPETIIAVFVVPPLIILMFSSSRGHYTRMKPYWTEASELVKAILYAGAFSIGFVFLSKTDVSRIWLVSTCLTLVFVSPIMRALGKRLLVRGGRWFTPLIIVGHRAAIDEGRKAIESDFTLGYRVAMEVDATHLDHESDDLAVTELSKLLIELGGQYRQPRLLLAFDHRDLHEYQQRLVDLVGDNYEHVIVGKSMYGLPALHTELLGIDKHDTLFFRFRSRGMSSHKRSVKRLIDVAGSSAALLLLAPLLALLALIVCLDGGKPFFASERIGHNGRRFRCYKFRSMSEDSDRILREYLVEHPDARDEWYSSFKLKNDPRITAIGKLLRQTSLDELPQFYNVLIGDMSLVGPRPILPEEVVSYGHSIILYQGVRPGLTGLWQISGRSELQYDERVRLNKWYVRNWSIWLDMSILFRTVPAVISSAGAV